MAKPTCAIRLDRRHLRAAVFNTIPTTDGSETAKVQLPPNDTFERLNDILFHDEYIEGT